MNLFFHGAADPMKQFEVQKWSELPQIFEYDLYFTNAAGFMLMGVVLCIAFFGYAASRGKIVPNRLQSMGEIGHGFVADMIRSTESTAWLMTEFSRKSVGSSVPDDRRWEERRRPRA